MKIISGCAEKPRTFVDDTKEGDVFRYRYCGRSVIGMRVESDIPNLRGYPVICLSDARPTRVPFGTPVELLPDAALHLNEKG